MAAVRFVRIEDHNWETTKEDLVLGVALWADGDVMECMPPAMPELL